ncbi:unnamed protein product [Amaranthus hypochondriacus]
MAGGGTLRNKKKRIKRSKSNSVHHSSMRSMPSSHPNRWLTRGVSIVFTLSILVFLGISSNTWVSFPHTSVKTQSPLMYTAIVVNEYPHDRKAFTPLKTQYLGFFPLYFR